MQQFLECSLIARNQILLLEVVGVAGELVVFPSVHDVVCVFGILIGRLPVDELLLRNIVVCWLVLAQLGFDQQSIARPVPRQKSFLVAL